MAFSSCAIVGASVVTDSMSSTLCFSYIHRIQYTHITSSEPKIVRRKDEVKVRHDFERKEKKRWYRIQNSNSNSNIILQFLPVLFCDFDRTLFVCVLLARNASPPGVVAALDPANADHLQHLLPEADGRAVEGLFVGVNTGSLPDQVCLERADHSGALEELPAAESDDGC